MTPEQMFRRHLQYGKIMLYCKHSHNEYRFRKQYRENIRDFRFGKRTELHDGYVVINETRDGVQYTIPYEELGTGFTTTPK